MQTLPCEVADCPEFAAAAVAPLPGRPTCLRYACELVFCVYLICVCTKKVSYECVCSWQYATGCVDQLCESAKELDANEEDTKMCFSIFAGECAFVYNVLLHSMGCLFHEFRKTTQYTGLGRPESNQR